MRASRDSHRCAATPDSSIHARPMSRSNALMNTARLRRPGIGMASPFQASRVRLAQPGPAPG